MFVTNNINQMKLYHRMGLNQKENLYRVYGNNKRVALAVIDFNKQAVDEEGAFFVSKYDDEHLVIDMLFGHVYKVSAEEYDLVVEDGNIIITDLETDVETELIVNDMLNWEDVRHKGTANYTMMSSDKARDFKGYPAVRFGNSYTESLRVHWVIGLMEWGIEVIADCVGTKAERNHDIHHKVGYKKSQSNSIHNLEVMNTELHEALHGYYWTKG